MWDDWAYVVTRSGSSGQVPRSYLDIAGQEATSTR